MNLHAILVEDEAALRLATTQTLELGGFLVTACASFEEAVELVQADFDGVIVTVIVRTVAASTASSAFRSRLMKTCSTRTASPATHSASLATMSRVASRRLTSPCSKNADACIDRFRSTEPTVSLRRAKPFSWPMIAPMRALASPMWPRLALALSGWPRSR